MFIGIVRTALRRPYTFVVMALLLLIVGPLAATRTPTDIFPEIRMPVIAVAWNYTGLPPDQMAGRISTLVQLTVNNDGAELLPGGYASVRFDTPATAGALSITPSALIVNRRGTQVAVVDTANRVQLKPVTVARDLGNVIELASGVAGTDRVIGNPPDGIATGDTVRIAGERKGAM